MENRTAFTNLSRLAEHVGILHPWARLVRGNIKAGKTLGTIACTLHILPFKLIMSAATLVGLR